MDLVIVLTRLTYDTPTVYLCEVRPSRHSWTWTSDRQRALRMDKVQADEWITRIERWFINHSAHYDSFTVEEVPSR